LAGALGAKALGFNQARSGGRIDFQSRALAGTPRFSPAGPPQL